MTPEELKASLDQFTGTNEWHRHSSDVLLTDGVKFLADEAGAYWLVDLIASYQKRCRKDPMLRDFQMWTIKKTGPHTASVTCLRDTNDIAFHQDIPFTAFPLNEATLYLENDVLMLPGER